MKKRIISLLLCVLMLLSLLPVSALAASPLPELTGVTLSGDTLSWTAFPGAETYAVTVGNGGRFVTETAINVKDFCEAYGLSDGSITVKVTAYDRTNTEGGQPVSQTAIVNYAYTSKGKLSMPQNVRWSGTFTVRWDAVENADSYVVELYRKYGTGTADSVFRVMMTEGTSLDYTTATSGTYASVLASPVPGEEYKVVVYGIPQGGRHGVDNLQRRRGVFSAARHLLCSLLRQ